MIGSESRITILKISVNVTTVKKAVRVIAEWASDASGRCVNVSNVHMCMEAFDNEGYSEIVNKGDLVVPDGMPLVWAQYLMGYSGARRIRGYDLTLELCAHAERTSMPVGFYGSSPSVLEATVSNLLLLYPKLNIVYKLSPPFRELTDNEDRAIINEINASGAQLLFVGLGCPKQEIWMAKHRANLKCVMVGVGAVFDFISGNKKHAPQWMQTIGLEWLFRFGTEPRRLWKRYLKHNPRFVFYFIRQVLGKTYV